MNTGRTYGKPENACTWKIRYRSKKSAENGIKSMKKKGLLFDSSVTIYHCVYCGGWHIGHNRLTRID